MSLRTGLDGARIWSSLLMAGNRYASASMSLTATPTSLQANGPQLLFIDPNGAKTVRLPASPKIGDFYIIVNTADAAEIITVTDSAGTALTPACTPTQSETAIVFYAGATLGWRNLVGLGA